MALTYTPEGQLGSACPDFNLKSVDGKLYKRDDFERSPVLVMMFICGHCPYVQAVEQRLIDLAREFTPVGAAFVGICSNDSADYPDDRPEALLKRWREKNYGFPYLLDSDQTAAKNFGAVCTPDFFVYDSARKLRYRGRLDDSWRSPDRVQRRELAEAVRQLLHGGAIATAQNPSMGCSIKWKD
jgi:peroxiredoxin